MSDADLGIDEKRMYGAKAGATTVYVGSATGVATASVSGGKVGEFGLDRRGTVVDIAGGDGLLAVATEEDVLVRTDDGYVETGFGAATAVGFDGDDLLAADDATRVFRIVDTPADPTDWFEIADLDHRVTAIDGTLLAAGDGVYRVSPDGLDHAGLDAANDVSTAGVPHAATDAGLYKLGNGWMDVRAGAATVVAADPGTTDPGALGRAHAVVDGDLLAYDAEAGEWRPRGTPAGPVVDVAYDPETTYAVAADGTLMADAGAGWEHQALGLPGISGLAVPARPDGSGA